MSRIEVIVPERGRQWPSVERPRLAAARSSQAHFANKEPHKGHTMTKAARQRRWRGLSLGVFTPSNTLHFVAYCQCDVKHGDSADRRKPIGFDHERASGVGYREVSTLRKASS